jgi:hypothetical protein
MKASFNETVLKILNEQKYQVTARQVLYRRYGKQVADQMIAKIRARGKDSYLEKKYALPDYSEKNLDKVIPVIFKDFSANEYATDGQSTPLAKNIKKKYWGTGKETNQIQINTLRPSSETEGVTKELNGGPAQYHGHHGENDPFDPLGHEITHTLTPYSNFNLDLKLQTEIVPVLGEIKRWYYQRTGILLDADATDREIDIFIDYVKKHNGFNRAPYGERIDYEKLLKTSEGKEVFKRLVKQNLHNTNTMVA